jgi:hypothetical protein
MPTTTNTELDKATAPPFSIPIAQLSGRATVLAGALGGFKSLEASPTSQEGGCGVKMLRDSQLKAQIGWSKAETFQKMHSEARWLNHPRRRDVNRYFFSRGHPPDSGARPNTQAKRTRRPRSLLYVDLCQSENSRLSSIAAFLFRDLHGANCGPHMPQKRAAWHHPRSLIANPWL